MADHCKMTTSLLLLLMLGLGTGASAQTTTPAAPARPNLYWLNARSQGDIVLHRQVFPAMETGGIYDGVRSEITCGPAGGAYAASQPGCFPFVSGGILSARGQLFGIFAYQRGLGIGNAGFANSLTECWGGSADVAPGSIPLCGFGEYDIYQGSATPKASVFKATVGHADATHLTYTQPAGEVALGQRFLLNGSHIYTAGTAQARAKTVTGEGTHWSESMVGKYFKMGVIDNYAAPCSGDDQPIDGECYGHWYKIKAVNSPTSLTIEAYYDTSNLVSSGPYVIADGVEITGFDTTNKTIEYSSAPYAANWRAGDVIYSPPNHLIALQGPNLIFRPLFKTGRGSMNDVDGIRFANLNKLVNMDTGIHFQGNWTTYMRAEAPASDALVGIDFSRTNFKIAAFEFAQNSKIISGPMSQYFDGTGWVFRSNAGPSESTRSVRFSDGNGQSVLDVVHASPGVVDLKNQTGAVWLEQKGNDAVVPHQLHLTAATGTAPLVVTSTTPVANLTAAPATYTAAGRQQSGVHIVADTCTLGSNCTVSFAGPAAFSSVSSYQCTANDTSGNNPVRVTQNSGSMVTFTGAAGGVVRYICVGN
jgi:hypothetical protein